MIKYNAPADPYNKFESDLARELSVKHFPIRFGSKKDRKAFQTLAFVLQQSDYPVFDSGGSDLLPLSCYRGSGWDILVESEGSGEEYFQNTNPNFSDEGYKTNQNYYYQGPTWHVYSENKKGAFDKTGVTRNQLADVIIEGFKAIGFDYEAKQDELLATAGEEISFMQKRNATLKNYLDGTETPTFDVDQKQLKIWERTVATNEKQILLITDLINDNVALSPDLNSTDAVERKQRSYFYGKGNPNSDYAPIYWVATGFDSKEAVAKVRNSMWCKKRDTTGIKRDNEWDASSISVIRQVSKEAADKLVNNDRTVYVQ